MFKLKQVEAVEKKIDNLENHFRLSNAFNKTVATPDLIECEKCGCLLYRNTAIKGTGEIRKRFSFTCYGVKEDYIYYPYYCKIHAPKVKK